jgi:hypothetical protein
MLKCILSVLNHEKMLISVKVVLIYGGHHNEGFNPSLCSCDISFHDCDIELTFIPGDSYLILVHAVDMYLFQNFCLLLIINFIMVGKYFLHDFIISKSLSCILWFSTWSILKNSS